MVPSQKTVAHCNQSWVALPFPEQDATVTRLQYAFLLGKGEGEEKRERERKRERGRGVHQLSTGTNLGQEHTIAFHEFLLHYF